MLADAWLPSRSSLARVLLVFIVPGVKVLVVFAVNHLSIVLFLVKLASTSLGNCALTILGLKNFFVLPVHSAWAGGVNNINSLQGPRPDCYLHS